MNTAEPLLSPQAEAAPAPAPAEGQAPVIDPPPAFLLAGADDGPAEDAAGDDDDVTAPQYEKHAGAQPPILALVEAASDRERPTDLPLAIEALLLVADEPPSIGRLALATNTPPDAVEQALATLEHRFAERGVRLQRHNGTVRLVTAPEAASFIERFLGLERPNRLSRAALETLAIIAYRQPVTRGDIDAVRGVASDGPLTTLRARDLIEAVGQREAPGRPNLYAVTPRFLEHFGLSALDDLPPLPDLVREAPPRQGRLPTEEDDATRAAPFAALPPTEAAADAPEPGGLAAERPAALLVAAGD